MRTLFLSVNHLFIADSLQLSNLTSRFGAAESFATFISFEKLDRSLSSSCPYFWRQFSAILAASQLYFVDIPLIRSNIKGGSIQAYSLKKKAVLGMFSQPWWNHSPHFPHCAILFLVSSIRQVQKMSNL